MSETLIQVIIQGGAVGLCLVAFGIVAMLIRLVTNHFVHFAALLSTVVEKLDRIATATERHMGDHDGRSD